MNNDLKAKLEEAKATVQAIEQQLGTKKANKMFRCVACSGIHKISSCDAWEPFHYNNAAYEEGWESDHELWAVCPKTGVANRFLFRDEYDVRRAKKDAGRAFFWDYHDKLKTVTKTMCGRDAHDIHWINNFYIDANRKKFDLPEIVEKS